MTEAERVELAALKGIRLDARTTREEAAERFLIANTNRRGLTDAPTCP